jgi:hypothetical protein
MTLVVKDRVVETSSTTGTGALALSGAITGYRAFSSVMSIGDTCYYVIEAIDTNGVPTGAWEVGLGTYSGVGTLTRTTVHASSNSNAAVSFAAGNKRVMITPTAAQLASFLAGSSNVDASAYTITGGPLSAPTEATSSDFGYGFSHASAAITANNFWFRTRTFSGDLTIVARVLLSPQSAGNNSVGIVFRESAATKFITVMSTFNAGTYCEVAKSTNDGASSSAAPGATSLALSAGTVPAYLKGVYVASTNTITLSVSLDGVNWVQLYSGTTDVTPNQVGFLLRVWSSSGQPAGGTFKFFSDSGNGVKWNVA